jgi:hypothetical protein
MPDHPATPGIAELLQLLDARGVHLVVVGSVATRAHGADPGREPADLDIVPDLTQGNLSRLADVLRQLDAAPEPVAGRWEIRPTDGEFIWVEQSWTPARRAYFAGWEPRVDDPDTFDHRFSTRLGPLDVIPVVAGAYAVLRTAALELAPVPGAPVVPVAHVDDLLAALTIPRRPADAGRVSRLRRLQRRRLDR